MRRFLALLCLGGVGFAFLAVLTTRDPPPSTLPGGGSARAHAAGDPAAVAAIPRRTQAPSQFPAHSGSIAPPQPPAGPSPVLGETLVRFEPEFRLQVFGALSGDPATTTLSFPLEPGRSLDLRITRHEVLEENQGVIHAEIAGQPGSRVILAYVDEAVAGTIFSPQEGLFRVRYQGEGLHRVVELDPENLPPEAEPIAPPLLAGVQALASAPPEAGPDPMPTAGDSPASGAPGPAPLPDGLTTTIELMVVYTPESAAKNGGTAGINALINAAIATANSAFSTSEAGTLLHLAYAGQVAYTGSGGLSTDLNRLRANGDGYLDEVHALRTTFHADLVSLLVPAGDYAGIGYLWSPAGAASFLGYSFTVVYDDYADANLTLAHEIGHNLGCGHALEDNAGGGAYSYSYGYHFSASGTAYRTVMAYAPGIRIARFSNPNLTFLGTATGSATANNTATLLNSKSSVAALQSTVPGATNWVVVTACDLDSSGKTDLIWRNTESGRVITWLMNGAITLRTVTLWPAANPGDSDWIPLAAGDFNLDGRPDLVWRSRASGRVLIWFMNGTTRTGTATIWPATNPGDSAWAPVLAGDFNADDRSDLVWRNSDTGRVIVWFMNGTTRSGTTTIWPATNPGDSTWIPLTAGDLNSDGKPDIVWRNSLSGRVVVWLLNGVTRTGSPTLWTALGAGDSAWVPLAAGEFTGDAKPDLAWRNTETGRVILWLMNGTTRTGTTTLWLP